MAEKQVKIPEENINNEQIESLKGALFSSLVFVGGGILVFMLLLFVIYMIRL
ncbi:hypothetical protein J2Z83_001111 [Virgibacillus natechei]|uniref:Cytochrome c oxidase subunit 2A n=1 Tax=Virgibacillus natechei TaxID=1216297 RepID=A0ABS4IDT1_9BACI|nr:hypothetical protein [Virgibacillus natechei]MBP1969008.1 hypothetical protein [Virgibacillus natechei]UZD14284.1 hypothetical protein OLD84_07185 [Virgibacillus natechei]